MAMRIACIIGGIVGIKLVITDHNHPIHVGDLKCEGKTYIVTGATGTLGLTTTFGLAKRNARIIMACRDMDKCKIERREIVFRTGNRNIACRKLDLSSMRSINEFADAILENEPRIDGLINNAGVMGLEHRQVTQDGFEMHLGVNYLGPYLLTMRLIDRLIETSRITGDSRIVNVTGLPKKSWHIYFDNINSNHNYNRWKATNQSKLALALFTRELALQLKQNKQKVFVYAADPGGTIHTNALKNYPVGDSWLYPIIETIFAVLLINSDQGAAKTIYCAVSNKLADHKFSGKLYGSRFGIKKWINDANDELLAKRVWLLAEKWVHLDEIRENLPKPSPPAQSSASSSPSVPSSPPVPSSSPTSAISEEVKVKN